MSKLHSRCIVSDFDGTMTKHDFFDLARRDLPSADPHDYWRDYLAGTITHFEALAAIFGAIRADETGMQEVLLRMELDPALPTAIARLRAAGCEVIVASAGCDWYIRRLLSRAGVALEVHANPGQFAPATGLAMALPVASPYFHPETGIDKTALVRAVLARDPEAVFVGDGRPDLAPALEVRPERRYATGWLAAHLRERGEAFHAFENWSQIADHLLEDTRC